MIFCSSELLYLLCFVFWSGTTVAISDFGSADENEILEVHLARRLRRAKTAIAKEYAKVEDETEYVTALSYDVRWERIGNEPLSFSVPSSAIRIYDKIFILEGNRTMSVDVKSAPTNDTSSAPLPAPIRQGHSIKFAKSIVWKSRLYLLVCEENDCTLYIGENDSRLENEQTLSHTGMFDAIFFTRDNRLYLVVTHDKADEFLGSSTIYRWTGTYMDILQPIETVGDVMVITFNYGRSTIMIFGQPGSDLDLEIYEFDNRGIKRIQYLSTNQPISILHYRHDGHHFLLIINEREASSVYWWDGYEFLHWFELSDMGTPRGINVAQLNGDTLFFVYYEQSVNLYKVTRLQYTRLDMLNLTDTGEQVLDVELLIDERSNLLTLLLITLDPATELRHVQPWKVIVKKNRKTTSYTVQDAVDATGECLSNLLESLKNRTPSLENLTTNVWPALLNSEKDATYTGTVVLRDLVITEDTLPAKKNPVKIGRIVVDSSAGNDSELLLPNEMATIVTNAANLVAKVLSDSRQLLRLDKSGEIRLTGEVRIEGDAEFRSVQASSLRTSVLNRRRLNFEDNSLTAVSATRNQVFAHSTLRGRNVTVHNLTIDRLCGIPQEFWLRREIKESNNIFTSRNLTDIILEGDTIIVKSVRDLVTTYLPDLRIRSIDGVNIADLLDNVFIPGENQVIKGNIIQPKDSWATIDVKNLVAEKLNGILVERLMTRTTDQNLTGGVFFAGKMLMKSVVAERINGIPVSDFAMVGKKNYFAGEVTLAKLIVLDNLLIENAGKFPLPRPLQIYESVTLRGNLTARNVQLESVAEFSLPSGGRNLEEYWTKSTNQTVRGNVRFDEGFRVDELRVKFLNDLNPDVDIVSIDSPEIFGHSLEFKNFTAVRICSENINVGQNSTGSSHHKLYDDTAESLIINEKIQLERLSVTKLYVENFNGLPVDFILGAKEGTYYEYKDSEVQSFESLTVKNRLEMENLYLSYVVDGNEETKMSLGRRRVDQGFLRIDEDQRITRLISDNFTADQVILNSTEGTKIRDFLNATNSTSFCHSQEVLESECSHLIVQGDALIDGDLEVSTINGKNSSTYLDELAMEDFSLNTNGTLRLESLQIRGDLTLNSLRGKRFDTFRETLLSKSRAQSLGDSKIYFFHIFVDDAKVRRINERDTENFIHVDSPLIDFDSDVTFGNLRVSSTDPKLKPVIRTKYLNGFSTTNNELFEKLANVSSRTIRSLRVHGDVSWAKEMKDDENAKNSPKLGTILKYALPRNRTSPFVVHTRSNESTLIESSQGVHMTWMRSNVSGTLSGEGGSSVYTVDVKRILEDSVLDDGFASSRASPNDETVIEGEMIFREDLACDRLIVTDEIGIENLESSSISDLASSIVRVNFAGDEDDPGHARINATMVFREVTTARKLVLRRKNVENFEPLVHGRPIKGIFTVTANRKYENFLPDGTYLEHLVVLNNANVVSLDSLNLDEFANDRIALDSSDPVTIHGNLQFNGLVRVSGNAKVRTINGIVPSNLVINDSPDNQTIHGNKTLVSGDIVIRGKTHAPLVAGVDLRQAYENSVLNDEPTEIHGDVIFEADVGRSSDYMGVPVLTTGDSDAINNTEKPIAAPTGFTNGIHLSSFLETREVRGIDLLDDIARNEDNLEAQINKISSVHLPEIFRYFEEEPNVMITEASNVRRVRSTRIEETTLLNLYTEESGGSCGLDDLGCTCRGQYVVEINGNEKKYKSDDSSRRSSGSKKKKNNRYKNDDDYINDANSSNIDTDGYSNNFNGRDESNNFNGIQSSNNNDKNKNDENKFKSNNNVNNGNIKRNSDNNSGNKINGTYNNHRKSSHDDNKKRRKACRTWRVRGSRIFYHYRDENDGYAINVATTSVSSSARCNKLAANSSSMEFTTISWMTDDREPVFLHRRATARSDSRENRGAATNATDDSLKIYGYLSDASVFRLKNLVYVALAIYYDPIRASHQTDSLVYVLDLTSNSLRLAQSVATSHAVGLHVFEIPGKGGHIFFACHADGSAIESVLYRFESPDEFRLLRSFPGGGSRHVKSVTLFGRVFLFLDDLATNSIVVYHYEPTWDNFYHYQSIYHESMAMISSIESFYTGEFRQSQVYVIVTAEHDQFFVYEFAYASKFQLVAKKKMKGILTVVPFDVADRRYIFAGTDTNSTLFRIVEQGGAR